MDNALGKVPEFTAFRDVLDPYFVEFATFMINQPHS